VLNSRCPSFANAISSNNSDDIILESVSRLALTH